MNSTLQAVIVTLGIFALAGLFGLVEALGTAVSGAGGRKPSALARQVSSLALPRSGIAIAPEDP